MKLCPSCMSEREEHEFHADARARDGLQRRCKACRQSKDKGKTQTQIAETQLHATVPPDWRVAGTAFGLGNGYARSYDGDWWRVSGTRLLPVYADDVRMHVMARGASEIRRVLEEA